MASIPTIRSISSPSAVEGNALNFTIQLSESSNLTTQVALMVTDRTATGGADYDTQLELSFDGGKTFTKLRGVFAEVPPNIDSFIVRVSTTQDTTIEGPETLDLKAAVLGVTGTGTIDDDDRAPTTIASVSEERANEGENLDFKVKLSAASSTTTEVTLKLAGDTATAGADFQSTYKVSFDGGKTFVDAGDKITVPANVSEFVVRVATIDDANYEGSETLTLSATAGGKTVSNTGTILENDCVEIKSISNASAEEGDSLYFEVTLNGSAPSATPAQLSLSNGTAELGKDFQGKLWVSFNGGAFTEVNAADLVVPAGTTKFRVRVDSIEDTTVEASENFKLNVQMSGKTASATGTIQDDDTARATIEVSDASATEGNALQFQVTVGASSAAQKVELQLTDGTAKLGTDYTQGYAVSFDGGKTFTALGGSVVDVPAAATSFIVRVATTEDHLFEGNETLSLKASIQGTNATNSATDTATGTIVDDETRPGVCLIDSPTVVEGQALIFNVGMSGTSTTATTVNLTLAAGTATAGSDYVNAMQASFDNGKTWVNVTAGKVDVPGTVTSFQVRVATTDDTVREGAETLTLSAGTDGGNTHVGTGTITDNEVAVEVGSVSDVSVNEGDAMLFKVAMTGTASTAQTVTLTLTEGTAKAGVDFANKLEVSFDGGKTFVAVVGGKVTVPVGEKDFFVRVATLEDTLLETFETLSLTASSANASATGKGAILDDDKASITVSDASAAEGDALQFTVDLSTSDRAQSVMLQLTGGTATAVDDFKTSYSVSFDAGKTWVAVTGRSVEVPANTAKFLVKVDSVEDTVFEGNETFTLKATLGSGTDAVSDTGTGTITDDETRPSVAAIQAANADEGDALVFKVSMSGNSVAANDVTLALTDGTAKGGTDFRNAMQVSFDGGTTWTAVTGGKVSVPGNATDFLVRVASTEDKLVEGDETFTLTASGGGKTVTGTGTILDDDSLSIKVGNASAAEGEALQFAVDVSLADHAQTVTLKLTDGSAKSGVDYQGSYSVSFDAGKTWTAVTGGTVSVPANTAKFIVKVDTIEDAIFEGNENLTLEASLGTGAAAVKDSGTGTITDDEVRPEVASVSDVTVNEGDAMVFKVGMSGVADAAQSVTLTLADGTAIAGVDYTNKLEVSFDGGKTYVAVTGGKVSVPAGEKDFLVRVATTEDTLLEAFETLTLTAASANASATGKGAILDDDKATIKVGDATAAEGEALQFTVDVTTADHVQKVELKLTDGTATAGADYKAGYSVSFDAGKTWVAVTGTSVDVPANTGKFLIKVDTVEDKLFEGNETFTLQATIGTGATAVSDSGKGTITDDETRPVVQSVSDVTVNEGDALIFKVGMSGASNSSEAVTLKLTDGTAKAGVDYVNKLEVSFDGGKTYVVATDGKVTVPAGEVDFLVRVATTEDNLLEAFETLTLTATSGAVSLSGKGVILDDEKASIAVGDASANEGDALQFAIDVGTADHVQKVDLKLVDGTATAGADFKAGYSVSFDNGKTWAAVTGSSVDVPANTAKFLVKVDSIEDTVFEGNEAFSLEASITAAGATVKDSGTGTITEDDARPTVAAIQAANADEGDALVFKVSMSGHSVAANEVTLTLADGTAKGGTDYTNAMQVSFDGGKTWTAVTGGKVSVPGSADDFMVRIASTEDKLVEGDETFTLTATGGGKTVTGTGTILDDDALAIKVGDATAAEGDALQFAVDVSLADHAQTVTLKLTDGTAKAGTDYQGSYSVSFDAGKTWTAVTGGTVSVPANTGKFLIKVDSIEDAIFEGNETLSLEATIGAGAAAVKDSGTGTITDDEVRPEVASVSDVTVNEGDAMVFKVGMSGVAAAAQTVTLTLADGTAKAGVDYVNKLEVSFDGGKTYVAVVGGKVSVPAGEQDFLVRVATTEDNLLESFETLTLTAASTNGSATGKGAILDDEKASIAVSDATAAEGDALQFTVDVTTADHVQKVDLKLTDGTATEGADYTGKYAVSFDGGKTWSVLAGSSVDVPANTGKFLIKIDTVEDKLFEGNETFTLQASIGTGATAVSDSGKGTITDDETRPVVQSVSDCTVNEGDELIFKVGMSGASASSETVTLKLADGTAKAGIDYVNKLEVSFDGGKTYVVATDGKVTVPAGATDFLVRVATTEDNLLEAFETLTLTATSGAVSLSGKGVILDDEKTTIAVSDAQANEGEALQFTIDVTTADHVQKVDLKLANGTAEAGSDFKAGYSVSFDGGKTWTTVSGSSVDVPANTGKFLIKVDSIEDSVFEGNETFSLEASITAGGSTVKDSGTGTIVEDETRPGVADITDVKVNEGEALVFKVSMSGTSKFAESVELKLADGTAKAGADYDGKLEVSFDGGKTYVAVVGGKIDVPAGGKDFLVRVASTEDSLLESTETFTLTATSNGQTATGTGTIVDDEKTTVKVGDAQANEGDALEFAIDVTTADHVQKVDLKLVDGTAEAGSDFKGSYSVSFDGGKTWTALTGSSVDVPANTAKFMVKVDSIEDSVYEGNETFSLEASITAGGATVTDSGTGTIVEDEARPGVADVTDVRVNEGDALVFKVSMSGTSKFAESVELKLADGTAKAGSDYANKMEVSFDGGKTYVAVVGGKIDVPAGGKDFLVRVASTEDSLLESNETFTLTATSNGKTAAGTGTIVDDEVTTIKVGDDHAMEGDALDFAIEVTTADHVQRVDLKLIDGTANSGTDFKPTYKVSFDGGATFKEVSGSFVDVPANTAKFIIRVDSIEDTVYEGHENFTIEASITTPTGTVKDSGTGEICEDEARPGVADVTDVQVNEGDALVFKVSMSGTSKFAESVELKLADGTAKAGSDYDGKMEVSFDGGKTYVAVVGGKIDVPAGGKDFLVRVASTEDTLLESKESFTLTASSNGKTASGTGTIIDDEVTTVKVSDAQANEGDALQFTIDVTTADHVQKVDLKLANGTAEAGSDFKAGYSVSFDGGKTWTAVSGASVDVPANTGKFLIKIDSIEDAVYEGNETFSLEASITAGGSTVKDSGTGTIVEDDARPGVADITDVKVNEGEALVFKVTMSGTSKFAESVDLKLADGTAKAGADYDGKLEVSFDGGKTYVAVVGGKIDVPAGGKDFLVRVASTEDSLLESSETFTLTATSNGQTATGTGTIVDDEKTTVKVGDAQANEGDALEFAIDVTTADHVQKVDLKLVNGTAESGSDFKGSYSVSFDGGKTWTALTGSSVDVPANTAKFMVKVDSIEDSVYEGNETFSLEASITAGGATVKDSGTGTIVEDDARPGVADVTDVQVNEGDALVFKVSMSGTSKFEEAVTLKLADGTAKAGSDYANKMEVSFDGGKTYVAVTGGVVNVPAGGKDFLVRVASTEDSLLESNETFTLTATSNGKTAAGTGTIIDDEVTTIKVGDDHAMEGDALDFAIEVTTADHVQRVDLKLIDGTANSGTDFKPTYKVSFDGGATFKEVSGSFVDVPANTAKFIIRVDSIEDTVYEGHENFTIEASITTPTGTVKDSGTGEICEDDARPSVADVTDVQVTEGEALVFKVSMSGTSKFEEAVELKLADGTAKAGSDYANRMEVSFDGGKTYVAVTGGSVNVPAGGKDFLVRVASVEDSVMESKEAFTLTATGGGKSASGTGTIVDDEVASVKVSDAQATEGDALQFTVDVTTADHAQRVNLQLASGTATVGTDTKATYSVSFDGGATFTTVSGNAVDVPANTGKFIIKVDSVEDTIFEGNETFTLQASIGTTLKDTGTGTIIDDDSRPRVADVTDVQANEGDNLVFKVTMSNTSKTGEEVTLNLSDGSARAGVDYSGNMQVSFDGGRTYTAVTGGKVTLPAGDQDFLVRVASTEDQLLEGNETFKLTASGGGGSATGTGTICDDEKAAINVGDASANEGSPLDFAVTLTAADEAQTVDLQLINGTATAGVDFRTTYAVSFDGGASYTALSGSSLSVPANTSSFRIRIQSIDDSTVEPNETFQLKASVAGVSDTGNGIICDNDWNNWNNWNNWSNWDNWANWSNWDNWANWNNWANWDNWNNAWSNWNNWANDPMVIDMNGDGIKTTSIDNGTHFDMNDDGVKDKTAWISGEDAFLVDDRDGSGQIENHSEMFGGENHGDGYKQLAAYDTNKDGQIDASDAGYNKLQIWMDRDGDGQTDGGELIKLSAAGIKALSLEGEHRVELQNGNTLGMNSDAELDNGKSVEMSEVWLKYEAGRADEDDAAAAKSGDSAELPKLGSLFQDATVDGKAQTVPIAADKPTADSAGDIGSFDDSLNLNNLLHKPTNLNE